MDIHVEGETITLVFSSLAREISPEELRTRAQRARHEVQRHPGNPYLWRNLEQYERALQKLEASKKGEVA